MLYLMINFSVFLLFGMYSNRDAQTTYDPVSRQWLHTLPMIGHMNLGLNWLSKGLLSHPSQSATFYGNSVGSLDNRYDIIEYTGVCTEV